MEGTLLKKVLRKPNDSKGFRNTGEMFIKYYLKEVLSLKGLGSSPFASPFFPAIR